MTQLFTSTGYLASAYLLPNGETLNLQALPAFLRVLLTTDGTVTKSLESFFWEPVMVKPLNQALHILHEDLPSLDRHCGERVLLREVALVGESSAVEYARAESYILTELLPISIREDLEAGRVGIGEMLRELGLETYRELLELGREETVCGDAITRRYRIVMHGKSFIQIIEKFPLSVYR